MDLLSTDTSIFNLLVRSDDNIVELDNETLREYVVTLKKYEDLDAFYSGMETVGGDLYIPNRQVSLADRRPISRNTHYLLTQFEAEELKKDPRVEDVDLTYTEKGLEIKPTAEQYSNAWSKQSTATPSSKNWALLRSFNGYTTAGWGSNGTTTADGTINITNTGKNVDVVICDGHILSYHPEFAVNADGSGGSRVVQYNWFQHNVAVRGSNSAGTYQYTFPAAGYYDHAHGMHVAGVVAGNTQGWARSANIYNISPYPTNNDNAATNWSYYVIDYIRAFHNTKPINPDTGLKNPTIVNLSWELTTSHDLPSITSIRFQGQTFNQRAPTATSWNEFKNYLGLISSTNIINFGVRDSGLDADIADALASGSIFVGGAGNFSMYNDVSTGVNFNNAIYIATATPLTYHRGSSPAAADGVINVSSVDSTVEEKKAAYSNAGPRTDIFAPGTLIVSSWYGATPSSTAIDPRNIVYAGTTYLSTYSGTSVASAQVAGILACALETYPRMTYTEAKEYIQAYATKDQLSTPPNGTEFGQPAIFSNINGILGGPNYYLKYNKEKLDYAETYPKQNYKQRPTSSRTYPRVKRRLKG